MVRVAPSSVQEQVDDGKKKRRISNGESANVTGGNPHIIIQGNTRKSDTGGGYSAQHACANTILIYCYEFTPARRANGHSL